MSNSPTGTKRIRGFRAEAARAYFKVGSLSARLDRPEEAERAMARAVAMFEDLAARFPTRGGVSLEAGGNRDHDRPLVGRTRPRSCRSNRSYAAPASSSISLPERSRRILDYVQSQIHVYAKLGAVMQRLDRLGEAESCYRRAIDFAGDLMKRSSNPARATIDRADVREALGRLVLDGGQREGHGCCSKGPWPTCVRSKE